MLRPLPLPFTSSSLPPAAPNELIARVAKEKTRESGTKWPLRNAVGPAIRPFVSSFAPSFVSCFAHAIPSLSSRVAKEIERERERARGRGSYTFTVYKRRGAITFFSPVSLPRRFSRRLMRRSYKRRTCLPPRTPEKSRSVLRSCTPSCVEDTLAGVHSLAPRAWRRHYFVLSIARIYPRHFSPLTGVDVYVFGCYGARRVLVRPRGAHGRAPWRYYKKSHLYFSSHGR